jgi:hypothetical protein
MLKQPSTELESGVVVTPHLICKFLFFMVLQNLLKLTQADLQASAICFIPACVKLPFQVPYLRRYLFLVNKAESPAFGARKL